MSAYGENWGLIGHEQAVHLLAERIAHANTTHAYLITGPAQIGKTTLAVRFAQALNCSGETPPCGQCRTCDLIARGAHPDVQIIAPEGRSIRIEAIRDLQTALSLKPFEARYRVAVILEAQKATDQAADALLKTLEEPPATTRLVLTAASAETVRPTVVSRCHVIALRPVATGRIEQVLAALGTPPDEAHRLARLSGGRPGWALTAMQQPEIAEQRAQFIVQLLDMLQADRTGRFAYSEEIARHEALAALLDTWQSWWRDVLLLVEGAAVAPVNVDFSSALHDVASRVTAEQARLALQAVRRTADAIDRNANTRLALDVMLLDMPFV
jgi:DNA polymerase-3 subunit delta'